MNCYDHPYKPAVASCTDCGKGLCYGCAHTYEIPICPQCNGKRRNYTSRNCLRSVLVLIAIFAIAYAVNPIGAMGGEERAFNAYMFTCIYGGWTFINRFMPRFLLIFSLNVWLIYFVVKAVLSALIGFFVTPFILVYNVVQLIRELKK